jgi:uncharacterized protein YacL
LLCLPLVLIGSIALIAGLLVDMPAGGAMSLPLTGTGIIFLSAAVTLTASGTLGELIYRLGDVRPQDFARLTMKSTRERSIS